ncbi:MAG: GNAT family N-acetyltransferase [Propionibacteriaceae bacterium]|nr:GNAT family N-acetyltransferase [Propionibacteriaceae bacterium]
MTADSMKAIRPARSRDTDEVARLYEICLRTGADGDDAQDLYEDPRLLGEVYLGAYLRFEPDLAFVIEDAAGAVLGYVVGARDTVGFEELLEESWWPPLRQRYPLGSFAPDSHDEALVRRIHTSGRTAPCVTEKYPAHLHVDLLPEAQGGGNGRALLDTFFEALRARSVRGVHLGVSPSNTRAIGFYRHLGFTELEGNLWGMKLNSPPS